MALGEFTKQIAQQAILSATSKEPPPPIAPQQSENVTAVFLGQIHAMQKALKDDEELLVQFGTIRVLEIFADVASGSCVALEPIPIAVSRE